MITYSIIKKSQLEGAHRLDAEYYQPEYLENEKIISSLPYKVEKFSNAASYITNGHTPLYADLSVGNTYFLTAEDVFDFYINYETAKRITKEASSGELKKTVLSNNDLLITIKGKIGNATVVYKLKQETNINQDLARVVLKEEISPFYLAAFLNSKFGKLQINRVSTNQINPFLGLGNLKEILIPILNINKQKKIEEIIKHGLDELDNSKSLYSQAENLLLEELGLKNFKIEEDLSYAVNLSDIKSAYRADAEYFQPKYDRLIKYLKSKFSLEQLNHLANKQERKIKPNSSEIYKYIEISDIKTDIGEVNYTERLGVDLPPNAKIPITGGELIISKVRPTRKAIAIVPIDLGNKTICSSAFTVYNLPTPLKEYIFITLRSVIGLFQLEKPTTGTEYPTLNDKDIENLLIPILPDSIQQQIAKLIQQSHEARKKAKELLEEAKQRVENLIEASK